MQLFWLCSSRPSEPHTRKCPSRDQGCCWTPFGLGDVSAGEEGLRREIAGGKYWLTSWNFSLETEFQVEIKMFRLCVSSLPEPSLWGSNKKICQKSEANITQSWLGLCSERPEQGSSLFPGKLKFSPKPTPSHQVACSWEECKAAHLRVCEAFMPTLAGLKPNAAFSHFIWCLRSLYHAAKQLEGALLVCREQGRLEEVDQAKYRKIRYCCRWRTLPAEVACYTDKLGAPRQRLRCWWMTFMSGWNITSIWPWEATSI